MNGSNDLLIHTEDATKIYNPGRPDEVCAVDAVTVAVGRGEVVALKGPSGSGKTSLLSLIGCMARPTSGRVGVDGRDVAKLSEEARNSMLSQVPLVRPGTPEDVANAVLFLASDQASYITGQIIQVNGGMAM